MGPHRGSHQSLHIERRDVAIYQLVTYLDEGYFEEYGVPRATDDNGFWLDWHYTLMYGTRKLSVGQLFSDYSIPLHGATINVIKESTAKLLTVGFYNVGIQQTALENRN